MQRVHRTPQIPASWFGIVVGLAGLGLSWRAANHVWGLPSLIAESILILAATVWVALLLLFGLKWIFSRQTALLELEHAVQSTYISLIGIATNLIAIAVLPYSRGVALALFLPASVASLTHGVFFTSFAWRNNRSSDATSGSLYLPTVAGCFVAGTAAAALGYRGVAQLAFGAGLFSWLSLESVLLHRLYAASAMPSELRPSLGIQFAPAAVAAVTYLSIQDGRPDTFARALLGYAMLQGLILLRLLRWIMAHPPDVSYWAFSFGAASLGTAACCMVEHGETGAVRILAPILFLVANILVAVISAVTLKQWASRSPAAHPVAVCP